MTCTTYTGTYTASFSVHPYTHRTDLHAGPPAEREQTYTGTYTTYTHRHLHAFHPLLAGVEAVARPRKEPK